MIDKPQSELFGSFSRQLLGSGHSVRFQAHGGSMWPTIHNGEILHVEPAQPETLRQGDIVLSAEGTRFRAHRLVAVDRERDIFVTRGDSGEQMDAPLSAKQILGRVVAKEAKSSGKSRVVQLYGMWAKTRFLAVRSRNLISKKVRHSSILMGAKMLMQKRIFGAVGLFLALAVLFGGQAVGQIAMDTATTGTVTAAPATTTLTFTHTTAAGTNRLLVVGVSLNVGLSTTTTVTGVTYNGVALTQAVAHNDAGPTRRAEIWYLVAPPIGTNLNVVVTVSTPTGQVGVVAGAMVVTGADQILPIRASASADGTASPSGVTVASAVGDMVIDTLAAQGNRTATRVLPQAQQWSARSSNDATPGVRGFGSTTAGAASTVTMSETLSAPAPTTNWSQVAVSIRAAVAATAVGVDSTTYGASNTLTGAAPTFNFNHTTAGTNTLLVVGVSINLRNNATASVANVTYNGLPLTFAGAHNDVTNSPVTRRVEMWYRVAPTAGTFPVVVTLNPLGATTVGAVAGATTFTGVDQTVPTRSFVSADGAAVACNGAGTVYCSQLNVTSGPGETVIDTLAIAGTVTATVWATQTSQWALTSGATADPPNVYGLGSTRTGAASVPLSETFSAASTWSMGALAVRPLQSDLSVAVSGTSAFNPAPLTYTITVTNNGTSQATGVVLNDTLATGLTFVSATPSQGTCSGTAPISCNIGTLASSGVGSSATITVVATPTTRGGFTNTASVISGVPDYNLGNNSAIGTAFSELNTCAVGVTRIPALTPLTGVINTYYPVTANAASGATSIGVTGTSGLGVATGATTPIASGDLLLIIQMQDAAISSTNDGTYGDGVSGSGSTNLNNAGVYEYVTATNTVALAGTNKVLTFTGAGPGGGLIYSYTNAAATATQGQRRFQVVRVPAYSTATLNATTPPTAAAWNGTTGGVFALDLSGQLTLNGATVSVDKLGFRGGAGMQLTGSGTATNADYRFAAPASGAYTGAAIAGADGSKGEGIAGTPQWIDTGTTYQSSGPTYYPSGTAGTDGSMGKGAPGNAGGGGTDGNPNGTNDQNAGGGGGGNGGNGGAGGNTWTSNLSNGGLGGEAFNASVGRVALGGGGGAGTRNNSDGDNRASAGGAGGGIVIIRAGALSGTGTITANGDIGYTVTTFDAGGGGGAGGSVVVLSATGGESGLAISAHGGAGGSAWTTRAFALADRHGPGGGGGGGVVLMTGAPASADISGGTNGTTLITPSVPYGATAGTAGQVQTNAVFNQQPGSQPGAECVPDLTITKTNAPSSFVRGQTGTYTLTVTNSSTGTTATTSGLVTVTDTLPAGLTATAISGTGWGCTLASLTCTRSDALNPGASYPTISVNVNVLQTAPNPVSNTANITPGSGNEIVTTNDSATDDTPVVSSADLAITKTASPTQPRQGNSVTYTLTVTNNGPSNASGVTVTDTLPTTYVTYVSATPSQGSCSYTSPTVTCNLGAVNNGGTATISIVVTASAQTGASSAVNTATVSATEPDPSSANNTATATITIISSTQVSLESFTATQTDDGVLLVWKTGEEVRNLGFHVYREETGERVRLNPALIAGSALTFKGGLPQHAAKSYAWVDRSTNASGATYWLEDVDLDGTLTMHGPVTVEGQSAAQSMDTQSLSRQSVSTQNLTKQSMAQSTVRSITMAELNSAIAASIGNTPSTDVSASQVARSITIDPRSLGERRSVQFLLAARPAVKIFVDHDGWYRITQAELVAAGLNASVDPRFLQLFAEGVEQPIRVTGTSGGYGSFGPQAAIEFYGTGIDTPYSDQRVYWLFAGQSLGQRIRQSIGFGSSRQEPQSFPRTIELKQHTTYFAALPRDGTDGFFGALVSSTPVDQPLTVTDLATASGEAGQLQVVVQGATDGTAHSVQISLNGTNLGSVECSGLNEGTTTVPVPIGLLKEGSNTVTLTAQNGDNDYSLVDYIRLTYPHTYVAESDALEFTANPGEQVVIHGFQQVPTRLLDITDPANPLLFAPQVRTENGGYALVVRMPGFRADARTMLAASESQFQKPKQMAANVPSSWHNAQAGADLAVVSSSTFTGQLGPLVQLRRSQGKAVAVADVDDLYDEFNFGERSPNAIQDFLKTANTLWRKKPAYLLLVGDASFDPRNYLGLGYFDFVPTKIVATAELKTATDDWFSDFTNAGVAQLSTGRLPVRTPDEAQAVVAKIVGYETNSQAESWTNQAMLVADRSDKVADFTQQAQTIQALLPSSMTITDVFATKTAPSAAKQAILDGINSGKLLVNYNGHGSVQVWSGNVMLDDTAAASLTNGTRLPVFLIMNCLNGFFHDVYTQSLAESLLLSKNGGAVAVWASSGLTSSEPQFQMNQAVVNSLFSQSSTTLGDAIKNAKASVTDTDVRRTFILFGDPLLRVKRGATTNSAVRTQSLVKHTAQ